MFGVSGISRIGVSGISRGVSGGIPHATGDESIVYSKKVVACLVRRIDFAGSRHGTNTWNGCCEVPAHKIRNPRPRHHPHILIHIDGDAPESGDDMVGQGGALTVDWRNVVIVASMQTGFCSLETPPLLC